VMGWRADCAQPTTRCSKARCTRQSTSRAFPAGGAAHMLSSDFSRGPREFANIYYAIGLPRTQRVLIEQ